MPYKDLDIRKEYKKSWRKEHIDRRRVSGMTEEQRIQINKRQQSRGLIHKRVYTDGGGEWICYKCHATREDDVQLHIHHKDQDSSNNTFSNLVCLCTKCHLSGIHSRWNNETIPKLIRMGIVDWTAEILIEKGKR